MTQLQSSLKKDTNGTRTLFECNQFRTPKTSENNDEPSESSVTRKRSIQSDTTTPAVANK